MNGIETREQRKAHARALVEELKDAERSLGLAEEQLEAVPDEDRHIVRRARRQHRVNHLNDRITAIREQLGSFTGGARTPRQDAETRSGGEVTTTPAPPAGATPAPAADPPVAKPAPAPANTGRGNGRGGNRR